MQRHHTLRSKAVIAAVAAVAVVAALSGCTAGGAAGTGGPSKSGTVHWWGWTPDDNEAQQQITAFNKQYPKIKVVFKKIQDANYNAALRPALASPSGPDVYNVAAGGATGDIVTFGSNAVDLTDAMVKARGADWKKGLYPAGISSFTQNGELKGAQVGRIAAGFVWINKGLFDQYGLSAPTTLDEWKQVCKAFRSKGLGCFREGIGQPGFDVDTLHSISDSIKPGVFTDATEGKVEWTDPTLVKAWSTFKELSTDGILDDGATGVQQYPDVNNAFLAGKVPMVQMGSWYQQYTAKKPLQAAVEAAGVPADTAAITMVPVPFPDVAGKGNTPKLFGDPDYGLAVNSRSTATNAAKTFVTWFSTSTAAQQIVADHLTDYPAVEDVSTDWDAADLINQPVQEPALKDLGKRINDVTQARQAKLPADMIQALVSANQSVIAGQSSPREAAEGVQTAFEASQSQQ